MRVHRRVGSTSEANHGGYDMISIAAFRGWLFLGKDRRRPPEEGSRLFVAHGLPTIRTCCTETEHVNEDVHRLPVPVVLS